MAATTDTVADVLESLTGYDEYAIEKHMGVDIYDILMSKNVRTHRCLIFVSHLRQGKTPEEAKDEAQSLRSGDVLGYFADDPEEIDPEEPETEAGKGPTPDDSAPVSEPTSASSPESAPPTTPL